MYHPVVIGTCVFAALTNVVYLFHIVDKRIAFGGSKSVNLVEEVVIITGGANGLGLVLAQMLGMQGATVAVLDVETPSFGDVRGVTFFRCDVSEPAQVEKVAKDIEKTVSKVSDDSIVATVDLWMQFLVAFAHSCSLSVARQQSW